MYKISKPALDLALLSGVIEIVLVAHTEHKIKLPG